MAKRQGGPGREGTGARGRGRKAEEVRVGKLGIGKANLESESGERCRYQRTVGISENG
jgi:hypothetical protein